MPIDAARQAAFQPPGRLGLEMGAVPEAGKHRVKYTPSLRRATAAEYSPNPAREPGARRAQEET